MLGEIWLETYQSILGRTFYPNSNVFQNKEIKIGEVLHFLSEQISGDSAGDYFSLHLWLGKSINAVSIASKGYFFFLKSFIFF